MQFEQSDDSRPLTSIALRVSDAFALCSLAVTSIVVWTVIVAAVFRFDLPLPLFLAFAGATFSGALVFGWCSGVLRDREAVRFS